MGKNADSGGVFHVFCCSLSFSWFVLFCLSKNKKCCSAKISERLWTAVVVVPLGPCVDDILLRVDPGQGHKENPISPMVCNHQIRWC